MSEQATEKAALTVPAIPHCPHCGQRLIGGDWGLSLDVAYCGTCRSFDIAARMITARAIQREPVPILLVRMHGIWWYTPTCVTAPDRLFAGDPNVAYIDHPHYRALHGRSLARMRYRALDD